MRILSVFLFVLMAITARAHGGQESIIAYAKGETEAVFVRDFDAPRETVFEAFTNDAVAVRWLGMSALPIIECKIEPHEGGALRYVWRTADGADVIMTGYFTAFAPPERFTHTEVFDDNWTGGEALLETVFEPSGAGTRVRTTIRYETAEIRDNMFNDALIAAIAENYDNLEAVLAE